MGGHEVSHVWASFTWVCFYFFWWDGPQWKSFVYLCFWAVVSEGFIYLRSFNLYTSGDFMVFGMCENGEGKLVFLFLQGLVCTGCLGYMFLESCPVKNEFLFPRPLQPPSGQPGWDLAGQWGRQQVDRGEGAQALRAHPSASDFPSGCSSHSLCWLSYQRRHGQAGLTVPSARLRTALYPDMPLGECSTVQCYESSRL